MSNEEHERPEDVEITLKPILGLSPETYIPILYGVLLAVIVFFVFLFPGIRHNGSLVTVVTVPANGSLHVDGSRRGATPGTFFVESGTRSFEARRPGFTTVTQEIDVQGRLVGSWLFPRRMTVRMELPPRDPGALVRTAAGEFSNWSLAGEASGQYQFPPIAHSLAADLSALGAFDGSALAGAAWDSFVSAALPHVASEALLKDLAAGALATGGETPVAVPSGISGTLQQLARHAAETDILALQIASVLAPEREDLLAQTRWVEQSVERARTLSAMQFEGTEVLAGSVRTYAHGLSFVDLPGGDVVLGGEAGASRGGDIPYRVSIAPFSIAATEVPFSAFQAFLDANPPWAVENRAILVDIGVVGNDYLADIDAMTANPDLPVTGISAPAAEAFAAWYTTQLPEGLVARLPTEAEWDFAVRVSGANDGVFSADTNTGPRAVEEAGTANGGVTGMLGNVWEWTADAFAPYGYLHPGFPQEGAVHRVVRGGGWATDPVGFQAGDRGSLDPSWCSPFVGFRLVVSSTSE